MTGTDGQILLVDSDREAARDLQGLLRSGGYEAVIAHDLRAALTALQNAAVRLVLIDLRLPGRTGLSLLWKIREAHPAVSCVAMSALPSTDEVIEALRAGAQDYLCKPFTCPELRASIDRCFQSQGMTNATPGVEERVVRARTIESLGKLTGGLAHDFNNLLSVIMGYSELLSGMIEDDSALGEYIKPINRAATHGRALTKSLLAFARRQSLHPRSVDLKIFLPNLQEVLNRTLGGRVELEIDISPGIRPVFVDPAHLEAALHAFLSSITLQHCCCSLRRLRLNPEPRPSTTPVVHSGH